MGVSLERRSGWCSVVVGDSSSRLQARRVFFFAGREFGVELSANFSPLSRDPSLVDVPNSVLYLMGGDIPPTHFKHQGSRDAVSCRQEAMIGALEKGTDRRFRCTRGEGKGGGGTRLALDGSSLSLAVSLLPAPVRVCLFASGRGSLFFLFSSRPVSADVVIGTTASCLMLGIKHRFWCTPRRRRHPLLCGTSQTLGRKEISVKTDGINNTRITAVVTVVAESVRLPNLVIFDV